MNKTKQERVNKILKTQQSEEESLDIDTEDKIELQNYMPFFF